MTSMTITSEVTPKFLKLKDLADRWGCSPKTLHNHLSDRRPMPVAVRLPGGLRFALEDVERFEIDQRGA